MDYLWWSLRSQEPPLLVPFLAQIEEICPSGACFETWDVMRVWRFHEETDLERFAARCQAWLYFGLVKVFLQDAFDISSFGSPGGIVSASTLPAAIRLHVRRDDIEWMEDYLILETLASAIEIFDGRIMHTIFTQQLISESFNVWMSGPARVLLSISLLIEHVSRFLSASIIASKAEVPFQKCSLIGFTPIIAYSLTHIGRCPSLIKRLVPRVEEAFMYLSFPSQDAEVNHKDCSMSQCIKFNVIQETYKTSHTRQCWDPACGFQGFDYPAIS